MAHSKKTAASKRAPPPRAADYTKSFLKGWERLSQSGRYDLHRLKAVMLLLIARDAPLGAECLDHALAGDWLGYRESHVGGDFLLIYEVEAAGQPGMVVFVRTGTHAELFE